MSIAPIFMFFKHIFRVTVCCVFRFVYCAFNRLLGIFNDCGELRTVFCVYYLFVVDFECMLGILAVLCARRRLSIFDSIGFMNPPAIQDKFMSKTLFQNEF